MSHPRRHQPLPDDLREVADALREGRPTLDPLALDEVKLRAMRAAHGSVGDKRGVMRSRLTTFVAVLLLTLATGGALALAGGGDGGQHSGGNASFNQDRPCQPGHGYGDKNHCHTGPPGQE